MSHVQEVVDCPQCGFAEADRNYNCRDGSWTILCRHCGYTESWSHEVRRGIGVLWYRSTGGL
jgi:predicted nucleic-acid-binding Zn-ribbon protein